SGEESRARSVVPSRKLRWPDCAAASPQVDHVRDETGSWYTDTYNFGCLFLVVTGDRAFNPNLKIPSATPKAPDCEAGLRTQSAPVGDREGRFEVQVLLNRVPYTITGQCLEEARDFCSDRSAQCGLVDRLIFLGGTKE